MIAASRRIAIAAAGALRRRRAAPAVPLPYTAILVSSAGLTLADSNTTVQSWAATLGDMSAALTVSAPGSSQRPVYDATGGPGGRPILRFDGSGDVLRTTALTMGHTWGAWQIDVVAALPAPETPGDLVVRYAPSGNALQCGAAGSNVMRLMTNGTGGATVAGTTSIGSTPRRMTYRAVSGASGYQHVAVDGAVEASAPITHAAWSDGAAFSIAGDAVGGTPVALDCLAVAVTAIPTATDPLTPEQEAYLTALLAQHTGVGP